MFTHYYDGINIKKMEVQVVSTEILKPSSPTPDRLRHYTLSFLDQLSLKSYSPFIYYYALYDDNVTDISKKLKKALSQTLTLYYPLAGRFINIEKLLKCNDEGALFMETRILNTRLCDVLKRPVPIELNKLLPFELDEISEIPVGVQLNVFSCGGIAIGVCVTHRLGDALSCLNFVGDWMAIASGVKTIENLIRPEFVSSNIFPQRVVAGFDTSFGMAKNMCTVNVTKRFVFDRQSIETLRLGYQGESDQKRRVSRVEVLSAFIWARFAASNKLSETEPPEKPYVVLEAVNIRPKIEPSLPGHSFGNYYTNSVTTGLIKSTSEENFGHCLAKKIGEDLRKVDKGFVEYLRVFGDDYFEYLKRETAKGLEGKLMVTIFSSLCRFPLYEADFGSGKPTWVSSAARGFVNTVGFMDNEAGNGIEAYVCLKPAHMERLEADKQFLAFVSP